MPYITFVQTALQYIMREDTHDADCTWIQLKWSPDQVSVLCLKSMLHQTNPFPLATYLTLSTKPCVKMTLERSGPQHRPQLLPLSFLDTQYPKVYQWKVVFEPNPLVYLKMVVWCLPQNRFQEDQYPKWSQTIIFKWARNPFSGPLKGSKPVFTLHQMY